MTILELLNLSIHSDREERLITLSLLALLLLLLLLLTWLRSTKWIVRSESCPSVPPHL